MGLHASELLKHNIETLLAARGQTRKDLAQWCRRSVPWLVQILNNPHRGMPLKYLDRIADFFAIATYQLLQPGISPLTERRSGAERRSARDRRISRRVLSTHHDVARDSLELEIRRLQPQDVATALEVVRELAKKQTAAPPSAASGAAPASSRARGEAIRPPRRKKQ